VEVAGMAEKGAAYASMLCGLVDRGLSEVKLVVSDDHEGIKAAVFSELPGVEIGTGASFTSSATFSRTCQPPRWRR
jgi:transposase-like protein